MKAAMRARACSWRAVITSVKRGARLGAAAKKERRSSRIAFDVVAARKLTTVESRQRKNRTASNAEPTAVSTTVL